MNPRAIILSLLFALSTACTNPKPSKEPTQEKTKEIVPEKKSTPEQLPDNTSTSTPSPTTLTKAKWIDVHTHCSEQDLKDCSLGKCCDLTRWEPIAKQGGAVVIASTEHYHLAKVLDPSFSFPIKTDTFNKIHEVAYKEATHVGYNPSLECWHAAKFTSDGWVAACKKNVDDWLQRGAIGFKDHAGKQYDNAGQGEASDFARWLGLWNRYNGFCTLPKGTSFPSKTCMEKSGVKYPMMESKWREVIKYITVEKKATILTHATSYPGAETCWNPADGKVVSCSALTKAQLVAFAKWAKDTLPADARKRIIIAHMGFLNNNEKELLAVLNAGLSLDTAIGIKTFAGLDTKRLCAARNIFGTYHTQWMFGTDIKPSRPCSARDYQAWLHLWSGQPGAKKTFDTCHGKLEIVSLGLQETKVNGCQGEIPKETLNNLLKDNYLRVFQK